MKIDKRKEDIELRANSEADLLAGLPSEMFGKDEDGETMLIKANHLWYLDWGFKVPIVEAVYDNSEPPEIITPTVYSDDFHANLRLLRGHTLDIGSQYKINSATPSRKFA